VTVKGQSACKHPADQILEGPYQDGYFTQPPFRVCKLCGYAEEGWHCGYWKLRDSTEVGSVSREYAMKYVINGIIPQSELSKKRFK